MSPGRSRTSRGAPSAGAPRGAPASAGRGRSGGSGGEQPRWAAGSLLDTLDGEDRDVLLRLGTRRTYEDQETLILEGAPGDSVFVLLDGVVVVTGVTDRLATALLAIRPAGELVGEMAVLDGSARTATVTAAGPVTALRISPTSFIGVLHGHPAAQLQVLRSVVRKLRTATRRRVETKGCDARRRLARILDELAKEYGVRRPDGTVLLELTLSQRSLGGLATVGASTVERLLASLRREGVLETGYRRLLVLDPARLSALCAYDPPDDSARE
ncbi:Crp/Fnr family transcriptional regulator [Streptomyces sp. NPDC096339]|uniref:Crp/Fnr family transcriptional regulator n=1 Tax=Streptomyces sp. NPDC096339 TaxID=3366086 RepID=UPI0037F5AD91